LSRQTQLQHSQLREETDPMGRKALPGVRTLNCSNKYVLVVEVDTMISMIREQTLQTMGYTAIVAENGRIAIEKF
jgi:DNA topoisomerase VI subunit A